MKKVLLLFAILIPTFMYGQDIVSANFPTKDGKIYYTEVVTVDSTLSASNLYINAKRWMVSEFKSSKEVIQIDNKDLNIIIGKGFFEKGHTSAIQNPKNWFIIKLEFKNGKYRYSIYDIVYEFDMSFMSQHSHFEKRLDEWLLSPTKNISESKQKKINYALNSYCREINEEFLNIIHSMKVEMSNKNENKW